MVNRKCPRCEGDLFIELESEGWEEQCVQCSYSKPLSSLSAKELISPPQSELVARRA